MSLVRVDHGAKILSFPRVSGDEPILTRRAAADNVFSPRERG